MLTKQNKKKVLALHVQKPLLAQGIIGFLLVVTVVDNLVQHLKAIDKVHKIYVNHVFINHKLYLQK
jgi:hypothetical protein